MYTFIIKIRWNGKEFEETIKTTSEWSARQLVAQRYPGCMILTFRRV